MAAAALKSRPLNRVLVVDDEATVCETMSEALEEAGLDVHCVQSDREAYALLGVGGRYVALLVDINLGLGTTGFDVARFARQMNLDVPIIYVSGQSSMASFEAFGVPGSSFLEKPFTPQELVRAVRAVIGDNDG